VISPRVVAIYGNGLGFGDITLPNAMVVDHTTSRAEHGHPGKGGIRRQYGRGSIRCGTALAHYPGVVLSDRDAFTAAQAGSLASQSDASLILDAVLLAYVMIAVVNSLVTATADRAREFELLRLIGTTRRQVRAMMRRETSILVAAAVIVGSLIALPLLIGVSAGMTRHLVPSVPPLSTLAIVAVVTALGWFSIMIPARLAMRSRTAGVLNSRQG